MSMAIQRLTIHGHPIAFRTAGDGPVLLLIHGMARSADTWERVLPALAQRFTVVAPDLLGHGESAKPRTEYSVSAHANLLRDLLAALGHEHATLIGHSLGGGVAMQLAYQFPERCERLVLVASGGLGREVSALLRGLSIPGVEQLFPLVCFPSLRDAGCRMAGWLGAAGLRVSPRVQEIWRSWVSLAEPAARRAFFRTLRAVVEPDGQAVSATDRLYLASNVPTLIVWGAGDTLIPVQHGVAAHAAIPGSRLEVFPEAGHFPHCEAPAAFVEAVIRFIDSSAPAHLPEAHWQALLRQGTAPLEAAIADSAGGQAT
jgi:pimeloyl-ACP methyl ester carboxylesterase